jgi:hypothetical protein
MSDNEIGLVARFAEFNKIWNTGSGHKTSNSNYSKSNKKRDEKEFFAIVKTEEDFELVKKRFEENSPESFHTLGMWLETTFSGRKVLSEVSNTIFQPQVSPSSPSSSASELYQKNKEDTSLAQAFDGLFKNWPRGSRIEKIEVAKTTFFEFARKYGVDKVVRVCNYYIGDFSNPESGHRYPYHLSNFLNEHYLEWEERTEYSPDPADLEIFNGDWNRYPDYSGKSRQNEKDDSFIFWRRHIKPEQRLLFSGSVRAYRDLRNDATRKDPASKTYTRSFIKHVGFWYETDLAEGARRNAAVSLTYAIQNVLIEKDLCGFSWLQEMLVAVSDCNYPRLWNWMMALLMQHPPETAVRKFLSEIPTRAIAEGRSSPRTEALRDRDVLTSLTSEVITKALLSPPRGNPLPDIPPPDPEWVVAEMAKNKEKEHQKKLAHDADLRTQIVVCEHYSKRFIIPVIHEETTKMLDGMQQPWRALAWWCLASHKFEVRVVDQLPQETAAVLISIAARKLPASGYLDNLEEYVAALKAAAEAAPSDESLSLPLEEQEHNLAVANAVLADPDAPRINPETGMPILDFKLVDL